jgi:TRAP-type uncharacterized transport system substrate-binding protein
VGAEGSGTKVLAMQLLAPNDVSVQNAKIFSQGWEKAAQMLIQGEIDAAFFVTAYHSPVIRQLLYSKDIQRINFNALEMDLGNRLFSDHFTDGGGLCVSVYL